MSTSRKFFIEVPSVVLVEEISIVFENRCIEVLFLIFVNIGKITVLGGIDDGC